jgi:hypothetical protein
LLVDFSTRFSRRPIQPRTNSGRILLRKEVIQPQVPLRLPCYDFIPVTAHSVDGCFPLLGWRAGFGYK